MEAEEEQSEVEGKQSLKDSILEMWAIVKACLTSFWFWVPPLFAIYIYLQLFLMLINPLLLIVGPAILIALGLWWEDKRAKAKYGVKDVRVLYASDPLFTPPQKARTRDEVDRLVEEYHNLLKKRKRKKDEGEA